MKLPRVEIFSHPHWVHKLSNLPKRSLSRPTSWEAVLFELILVNPTMSANKMLTLSMVFILKGRKMDRMSPWFEDRGEEILRNEDPAKSMSMALKVFQVNLLVHLWFLINFKLINYLEVSLRESEVELSSSGRGPLLFFSFALTLSKSSPEDWIEQTAI